MMMFRDKNNAPIKADSVHVKGSIFTGSGKPFEFEVNKGVCTNCKIQNDMLLFNIVPLLGLGQMQVYTQTYLGDTKAITGTYISENQQKLGVEVVQKGTFLSDRQGAMWVDVYLPIEINDAAQIPWVPAGADEQWIKDYLDKYVKTPAFAATLAALGGASKNLSNVDAKDFEKKAKDGNFAQNDLADVDLAKLKEKGLAAGLADAKNPISPTEFDRMIKQNAAFIALPKTAHPATAGKTNEQIKALFYANRQEVQKGVNLNTDPYNKIKMDKIIILDAGHGNNTAGKRSPIWGDGSQLLEWEFNRDIVRRIAAMLKAEGIKFEILVPEDNDVSLPERCRRANVIHADCGNNAVLFSIHGNAGGGTGWECYTSVGQTKADAIATVLCKEAEKEFAPDGWKMRFDHCDGDPDKESQFYILKHTVCPAVLSENFFFDNEKDCRFMMSDDGKERIAKVHFEAIKKIV